HVFNKIDRLDRDTLAEMKQHNGTVYVSGLTGAGLDDLLKRVDEVMPVDPLVHLHFSVPLSEGRTLALIHGLGRVLHSDVRDSQMEIDAELPQSLARRLHLVPTHSEP